MTRILPGLLAAILIGAPACAEPPAKPDDKAKPAAVQPPPPTSTVEAGGVIGRAVLGPDGKELGRIVDVLVDANSHPRAAVIDFGGFLGVGSRRIAVDWSDLTFPPTGKPGDIKLDLPADTIRNAPAYTDQTKPAAVVDPNAGAQPSGH